MIGFCRGHPVKAAGFPVLLMVAPGCAFLGFCAIALLPAEHEMGKASLKPAE